MVRNSYQLCYYLEFVWLFPFGGKTLSDCYQRCYYVGHFLLSWSLLISGFFLTIWGSVSGKKSLINP